MPGELVESIVAGFAQETGVLTFEVERIAFDPMLTDWNIRSEMSGAPTPGWAERDYYASRISFAVTYRATYDHEKTFLQDTEHAVLGVHLRRDGAQAPWEYQEGDHGIPVAEYSDRAMDTAELDRMVTLGGLEGRLLGGYQVEEGTGCICTGRRPERFPSSAPGRMGQKFFLMSWFLCKPSETFSISGKKSCLLMAGMARRQLLVWEMCCASKSLQFIANFAENTT